MDRGVRENMDKEIAHYEERIIAFVDILGAKDLIKNDPSNILDLICHLSTYGAEGGLMQAYPKTLFASKSNHRENWLKFDVATFSDSIAISFPLLTSDNKSNLENLRALCIGLTLVYVEAFSKKILLRGSITKGSLYHKWNTIIGEALVNAYEMEQKIAFYPRIILSKEIEEFIEVHNIPSQEEVIFHDGEKLTTGKIDYKVRLPTNISADDGFSYLNWLHWFTLQEKITGEIDGIPSIDLEVNLKAIESIKNLIEKQLRSLQAEPAVLIKWQWIACYFNDEMLKQKLPKYLISVREIT